MLTPREQHNNGNTYWYNFHIDGVLLGQAQIKTITYDGNNIYYEIFEPYRGNGLGDKLLQEVLKEAQNLGLRQFTLLCEKSNEASRKLLDKHCGKGEEIIRYVYEII